MDSTVLDGENYLNLVTFKRDGSGVETPVWFANIGGLLYVFTAGDAYKVKRLRRDSRVRVAPCSMSGRVTGPWLPGSARLVDETACEAEAYVALGAKYGWQMKLVDWLSRLGGRIDERRIIEINLDAEDR
ncbi:MAG: PPOX class F420-dependent oxidoreductase [Candidatus Binatia bacterium]